VQNLTTCCSLPSPPHVAPLNLAGEELKAADYHDETRPGRVRRWQAKRGAMALRLQSLLAVTLTHRASTPQPLLAGAAAMELASTLFCHGRTQVWSAGGQAGRGSRARAHSS